jgi:16S rRNA (uracil1498-N3)-methyltransferase
MRQFILPEDWDGGPSCLVEGGRARYVARVLRLGPGDSFPGLDSGGRPWTCTVVQAESGRLLLSVAPAPAGTDAASLPDIHGSRAPVEGAGGGIQGALPRIVLVQGLPKGAKMDLVVRQATEAGVAAVIPLLSARSVAGGFAAGAAAGSAARGEAGGAARLSRWERIVREAMQQSGSATRTRIFEALAPSDLPAALSSLGLGPEQPRILLHEAPLAQSSMHEYLTGAPDAVALCVGPEGGFAPDEVDFFLDEGFKPLRFAGAVLRAETAALYAIAAAQIILSERSSWIPKHR